MKFDLHIHSCLSPCASLEMSPAEIVARAAAAGLGGIALTDHQSARNCPAMAECARRAGIACLYGLEVQTSEEVHTVALFDTVEQALELTEMVYTALPKRVNAPEVFGDQPVVTADDEVVELEWRILAMGCRLSISDVAERVRALGGLYLAAHVDRPNFSVLGSLGAVPDGCFDAVEVSRTADAAEWARRTAGYAMVRSSDAHHLDDVARVWTEADLPEFSVSALREAFRARTTRLSPPLVFPFATA